MVVDGQALFSMGAAPNYRKFLKFWNYATLSNCYYFPKWAIFERPLEFEFDSLDTTAGNMAEE